MKYLTLNIFTSLLMVSVLLLARLFLFTYIDPWDLALLGC